MRVAWRGDGAVVVDKAAGIPCQATRRGQRSLLDDVADAFGAAFPVHRLDQPASGAVLVALDAAAAGRWSKHLREGRVERAYVAVLVGSVADGDWVWPIDGRPARTSLRVTAAGAGLTAVELRLDTGRYHQIRQHAALAGAPIAGDRRYGVEAGRRWPRLALHAHRLGLPDGTVVACALPTDLAGLWGHCATRSG